jgi:hypothetical protein
LDASHRRERQNSAKYTDARLETIIKIEYLYYDSIGRRLRFPSQAAI